MVVIRNQPGMARWKRVVFWALAIALSAVPLQAQKGTPPSGGSGGSRGSTGGAPRARSGNTTTQPRIQPDTQPGVFIPPMEPLPKPVVIEDETCLPWDLPDMRGATVSAIRLGVPSKARNDYEKACGAFKRKKLPEAEQHVRDAIQKYSNYGAAWVMLGQVLQDEQKMNDAHDACSQALSVDPTYLPPYLCLAGLLDREKQWGALLTLSDRFLGMNPVGDRYAYYYRAIAHFHLYNLPEAQKSVSQAIVIDSEHHQPGLYFLLAQIYGEQGDMDDATAQIRQFLKLSNSRQDKDAAKHYLADLQLKQNVK
jgi:predicted Zn-dependent protease